MFDIGWTEMLVVAVVAILFVGPKELPAMLRTFGKSVKKVRTLAGDFQRQFDDALKDAELDGVKSAIDDVRKLDPTKQIKDKLNPLKTELDEVKSSVEKATDYDAGTLFDESKAPDIDPPVEVDVEAALEKQRKIEEEQAKLPPSSGVNAVPGFGGPPGTPSVKKATAPKKASKTKTTAQKAATAKAKAAPAKAKKPAVKEKTATVSKATAKKPVARKPADKRQPAKRPPAKKAATKKAKA